MNRDRPTRSGILQKQRFVLRGMIVSRLDLRPSEVPVCRTSSGLKILVQTVYVSIQTTSHSRARCCRRSWSVPPLRPGCRRRPRACLLPGAKRPSPVLPDDPLYQRRCHPGNLPYQRHVALEEPEQRAQISITSAFLGRNAPQGVVHALQIRMYAWFDPQFSKTVTPAFPPTKT